MSDDRMQSALDEWFGDTDPQSPGARHTATRVLAQMPQTRQRGRWLPFRLFRPKAQTATATDTAEYQPSPIPASNGQTPTVIGRTRSMFSPAKAITAGALVFAIGGFLLIGQPFDQQGSSVPGAATDEGRPTIEKVTGQFVAMGDANSPKFRYGTSPDGNDYYRDEVSVGLAEMSDERLSGKVTITQNNDYSGSDIDLDETVINWGTVSIENDAGTWVGTRTLLDLDVEEPAVEYIEVVGTEAYEGWSAILYRGPYSGDASPINLHPVYGAVFSGNLPPDRESFPLD